jgi:hypothetical protein
MEDEFLRTKLQYFLQKHHTCPELAHTLLDPLFCDLQDARYANFRNKHGANDPCFRKLHLTQAFVGWSQLFQGRFVQDWSRLQDTFLDDNNAELKLDQGYYYYGDLWLQKLISLLWTTMQVQWDHRNADRHGHNTEGNQAIV